MELVDKGLRQILGNKTTDVVSGLQGLKASPSYGAQDRDLNSDVLRQWEQTGKVPGKVSTEANPEGWEEGGRVSQREQRGGQRKLNTCKGQGTGEKKE